MSVEGRTRWLALVVLCCGNLMIVLDVTIVGVALPGLLLSAVGLALFARAPVGGNFALDVLPSMILLGIGAGMALNPVLLAAISDVDQSEVGLASGAVNTSFMLGGALGLAILASLAASRTGGLLGSGAGTAIALNGGYHIAFLVGAAFAAAGALLGAALLRTGAPTAAHDTAEPAARPSATPAVAASCA